MAIKAVVFDIGGALDKGKPEEHWENLCKRLKIDIKRFQEVRAKYTPDARIGKLSTREYISKIANELGLTDNKLFKEWLAAKRENMVIDKEIEKLMKKLKENGYKVATISNIIELHHQVRLENKAYNLFDVEAISFIEGIAKPNRKIYDLTLKRLKLKPEECIFIDDSERNLEAAKEIGFVTILFKNNTQLISDFKKIGVKI